MDVFGAVNHLDYLGVQVAWISGPWFLSIFVNMIPWESGKIYFGIFFLLVFNITALILNLACSQMLPFDVFLDLSYSSLGCSAI
jgi:hypothetical protein